MRGRWLTPNTPASGFICRLLRIPNSEEHLAIVNGALMDLAYAQSFEEFGTDSPDDTAALFAQMYEDYIKFRGCMIGTIFAHANTSAPIGSLPCDGGTYLKADYPLLYAALHSAFIVDSTHFKTPDLMGRTVIGVGSGSGLTSRAMNASGGEETHVLTTAELASHTHTYLSPALGFMQVPATPVGAWTNSIASNTGATGSNTAHQNMSPFRALSYAIWAQ